MLTEVQKKLAEENIRLAYYVAHRSMIPLENAEKVSLALLGLTKAAGIYDPDKGIKFATLATAVMKNEIRMGYRKEHKHLGLVHFEEPAGLDDERICLKDMLPDKQQFVRELEGLLNCREAVENMDRTLFGMEQKLFRELIRNPGRTQSDYAERLGCSQSYVSRCLGEIRRKIRRELCL